MRTFSCILVFLIGFLFKPYGQGHGNIVKVDTTITGFHFAADFQGTHVYTKNGASDISSGVPPSAFSISISKSATFDQAKKEVLQLLNFSKHTGILISNLIETDTVINGRKAYLIAYNEKSIEKDVDNRNFNAVVDFSNFILVFTSGDLDKGKYADVFRQTFYSIKN